MYVLEYCDNPENGAIYDGHCSFDDSFSDEYESRIKDLDRFIFLTDMFQIAKSCSTDFLNLPDGHDIEFWEVNKALINYLNAVYSYKEYVNSYDPPLKEITDGYYYNQKWYRFVCDYRNRVIHQSTILRDRNGRTGDVFIDIDDIISIQQRVLDELIQTQQKKTQINNARRFLRELQDLRNCSTFTSKGGKQYKSMKEIVSTADTEISSMNEEILLYAFKNGVIPALKWLLAHTHKEGDVFKYTFIVNKQWVNIPEKEPFCVYEPTITIECFLASILCGLGKDNTISKEVIQLLKTEGYSRSCEFGCSIDEICEMV